MSYFDKRQHLTYVQLKSLVVFLAVITLLSASPTQELALAQSSSESGSELVSASDSDVALPQDSGTGGKLASCSIPLNKDLHAPPEGLHSSTHSIDLDQRLNGCIQETLVSLQPRLAVGIPELHIPPLDPYEFGEFRLGPVEGLGERLGFGFGTGGRAKNQMPISIAANFTNVMVHNLTNEARIEVKVNRNTANSSNSASVPLDYRMSVPSIRIEGNYSLIGDGLPLFRRIEGQGPFWMELSGVEINGTKILSIPQQRNNDTDKTRTEEIVTVKHIKLELQNLFNGNQMLGAVINRRLSVHAMDIFDEIKPQFVAEVGNIIQTIADSILL